MYYWRGHVINYPNIYYQQNHKPFIFDAVSSYCNEYAIDGIVQGKYLILTVIKSDEYMLINEKLKKVSIESKRVVVTDYPEFVKHHVYFSSLSDDFISIQNSGYAHLHLIEHSFKTQINWIDYFTHVVHEFLMSRMTERGPITSSDSIQITFSELAEWRALLAVSDQRDFSQDDYLYINKLILSSIKKLAECAGGRSFLAGNILELYSLTTFLNHFLLRSIV